MEDYKISMRAARINADLKQCEIATLMGVSPMTIKNWESGKVIPKPAQFAMYCDICKAPKDIVFLGKL